MSEQTCVARVWNSFGGFGEHRCSNTAKVVRDGKGYCGMHDPERVAAKRKVKNDAWDAERAADQARRDAGERRAEKLGGGQTAFYAMAKLNHGYSGGVTLTAEEADALIARLDGKA